MPALLRTVLTGRTSGSRSRLCPGESIPADLMRVVACTVYNIDIVDLPVRHRLRNLSILSGILRHVIAGEFDDELGATPDENG